MAARNAWASARPPEQIGLRAAALTPRFPQVTRQQRGQHGFANAGVRAGDKERRSLHSGNIKAEPARVSHQNR